MARLNRPGPARWCMICDVDVITCKNYINLSSSVTSRSDVKKRIGDVFGASSVSKNKSEHLCRKCLNKVKSVHQSLETHRELVAMYERTFQKHDHDDELVPVPNLISENKRQAAFSPGTPSSKHVSKKLHRSPSTRPKSKTRIDFQSVKDADSSISSVSQAMKQCQVSSQDDTLKLTPLTEDSALTSQFLEKIREEVHELCKPATKSAFRESSLTDLQQFSFREQALELRDSAPTLLSVLEVAAENPRPDRNREKKDEVVLPRIVTAASVLFNTRSQQMNSHQELNSLTLKTGCAKKGTFQRLQSRGLCTSYPSALAKQSECGVDFDAEVRKWAHEVDRCNQIERELMKVGDREQIEIYNKQRSDRGYMLVMDNVDIVIQARHPTRENYGKDFHMVQMLAVLNRVSGHHLSSEPRGRTLDDVDTMEFLPSMAENIQLTRDWVILSARMIAEHIPSLKPIMETLPPEIVHEHMEEMSKKSEVVNLGVLMENENTSSGIYKIMHHMHGYVPGHGSEHPTTLISAGDLLTCERESSCIEEQRNSSTPSQRLEGLMPVIADFHALANFYQVIWKALYDPSSAGDKGTLYSARNYLEARKVTTNPIKNMNAASDLLEKYTTALVLAAAMDYFGLESLEADPTKHTFSLEEHENFEQYASSEMNSFVRTYMIPSTEDIKLDEQSWKCDKCNANFATRKGLVNHEKTKHTGTQAAAGSTNKAQDQVLNYSRCALGMCMLAMDFNDARQMGDGARLMRLYKIILLHCKAAQKPKYSFHILRMLAQVQVLLSPRLSYELVWNRFINTKGKSKCNVEPDRVLEHHNGVFKENARGFRGKITQKSVDRVSRSAQAVHSLLANVDQQMSVKKPSAKRQSTGKKDVASLAVELHQECLFSESAGRRHSTFPNFPVTLLGKLEVPELHRWINATLKTFSKQNQFSSH